MPLFAYAKNADLNNFRFSFHIDHDLSSLPKEAVFQGVVLPLSGDTHTTPSGDDSSSKNAVGATKEEANRIKMGRRSRRAESHSSEVKILESNMVELEIGFDCDITTPEEPASKTSTFNTAAWLGIDWKASLHKSQTNN